MKIDAKRLMLSLIVTCGAIEHLRIRVYMPIAANLRLFQKMSLYFKRNRV